MTNGACRSVEVLLGAYADGELSPEEVVRLEAHLTGCQHCKDALATIQELDRALLALEAPEVSPAELDRLAARMKRLAGGRERGARRRSWRGVLSWSRLVPVAAATAALIAVFSVTRQFPVAERRLSGEGRLEDSGSIPALEEAEDNQAPIATRMEPAPDAARRDRVEPESAEKGALSPGADQAGPPAPSAAPEMAPRPMARSASPGAEAAATVGKGRGVKGAAGFDAAQELAGADLGVAAHEPDSTRAKSLELRAIALSAEAHAATGSEEDCAVLAARIESFIARHPGDARIDSLRTIRAALPCAP